MPQMLLQAHGRDLNACTIAPFGGHYPIIFTGGEDELVKAWDIRHTKACLYELAAGTMQVQDLVWHEENHALFIAGKKLHQDRMG